MITFKLEDADAVALVNTISNLHFEPSFLAVIKAQMPKEEQAAETFVEIANEPVAKPAKKTK